MAFEFSKSWESFIIEFSSSNISVESLVGGGIEVMVTASTDGSFEEVSIRVGNSGMVAITG